MKKTTKRIIATAAVCVLTVGVLAACGGADAQAPADGEQTAITDTDDKADAQEKEDSKSEDKKSSTKASDDNKAESSNNGGSGKTNGSSTNNGNNGGGNSGGNTKPSHTHSWATRYVVDKAAWTETVHHDADGYWTDTYDYYQCNGCGFNTTSYEEIQAHMKSSTHSYRTALSHSEWIETSPEYTETVNHPEKGHNETYCTKCGAVK